MHYACAQQRFQLFSQQKKLTSSVSWQDEEGFTTNKDQVCFLLEKKLSYK